MNQEDQKEESEAELSLPNIPDASELPEAPSITPTLPPRPAAQPEERNDLQKAGIAYTLPASLIAPIIVLTVAGYYLDERFGKYPALTIIGALIGSVAGFINMIRIANKLNR